MALLFGKIIYRFNKSESKQTKKGIAITILKERKDFLFEPIKPHEQPLKQHKMTHTSNSREPVDYLYHPFLFVMH